VHAVTVAGCDGRVHELVLRRFVRAHWLAEEPHVAEREAAALVLLAGRGLPTPQLVAVDPGGSLLGVPAVLMTRPPGRIEWDPPEVEGFLRRLAEPLPIIHATPLPRATVLPGYQPYPLKLRRAPVWALSPGVWWRAFELLDGLPPPSAERAVIHRDYHAGRVGPLARARESVSDVCAANEVGQITRVRVNRRESSDAALRAHPERRAQPQACRS
jgi:aminoglycoside phosphotransferase (APT) family kinase protein